jgi:aspartyl protease family protein
MGWRMVLIGILLIAGLTRFVQAVEQIIVEGLFPGMVMVSVDGVRRLLKVNQPSPEGLILVSATSKEAVIEIDGKPQTYRLGAHISTQFNKPDLRTAKIWRNQSGAYTTVGSINGLTVRFLVDTGATAVAMHANQAKRLGISYRIEGRPISVSTASGVMPAYEVLLERVQVGDITLHQVRGFVIDSHGPTRVLLGMSFLNRVNIENQSDVMLLKQRF